MNIIELIEKLKDNVNESTIDLQNELRNELKSKNISPNFLFEIDYIQENIEFYQDESETIKYKLENRHIETALNIFKDELNAIDVKFIQYLNDDSQELIYQFNIKKLNELLIKNEEFCDKFFESVIKKYNIAKLEVYEVKEELLKSEPFKNGFGTIITDFKDKANQIIPFPKDKLEDIIKLFVNIKKELDISQDNIKKAISENRELNSKLGLNIPRFHSI